uniref:hypothetical protein n=1 Tax=Ascoseira mirabilis TaxID=76830 RepID=UPI0030038668|nr:hypothetical protein ASMI172 [Ascoseira mirabilis]
MKKKAFLVSLSLNGYVYKMYIHRPCHLPYLLNFFSYQKELIIIEQNGKIYNTLTVIPEYLKQGDKLEIITIVGGG